MDTVRKVATIFATVLCLATIAFVAYPYVSSSPRFDRERAYQWLLRGAYGSTIDRDDPAALVLIYFPTANPRAACGVTFKSTGRIWYMRYLYDWATKGHSAGKDRLSPADKRAMEKICKAPPPSTDKPVFRADQVIAFFQTPGGSEQRLYTRSNLPRELSRLFEESLKREGKSGPGRDR